jgi:hypothetical protein
MNFTYLEAENKIILSIEEIIISDSQDQVEYISDFSE